MELIREVSGDQEKAFLIGIGFFEAYESTDSVADRLNEFGGGGSLEVKIRFKDSLKSMSLQKVSQTDWMDTGGSQEVQKRLILIETGFLEVCECPEGVTDFFQRLWEGNLGNCNLEIRTKKLELRLRTKKLELGSKKLELRS